MKYLSDSKLTSFTQNLTHCQPLLSKPTITTIQSVSLHPFSTIKTLPGYCVKILQQPNTFTNFVDIPLIQSIHKDTHTPYNGFQVPICYFYLFKDG